MRPLIHIGYHKTGSTWLARHLFRDHGSGLYAAARPRALHSAFVQVNQFAFDADATREALEPGMREAQARDLVPVLSHERLSGNSHSGGYDSKAIADRLVATFPDARVLLVIREQTSMLVSLYKQYVKRGGAASFERYVGVPPARGPMPAFRFDFLEYHHLIGYYHSLFGAANVLTLTYELLRGEPQVFLARIGEFLGTPAGKPETRWENVSPSAFSLDLKRHVNRYFVRDAVNPSPPLAFPRANELLLAGCRKADARIPREVRARREREWHRRAEVEIGGRYAKSNSLTARLTATDLAVLGYDCG
ncbi:MAG TPA: sulfotransferase domain-containing protein [Rubrobacteraceae bacterium]|nr:sulfotransferase domain-containing protein [Rubrobacteraceae bacterium]